MRVSYTYELQLRRKAGTWERSFVVVALLLFTNAFTAILPPEHNNIELVIFFSIYIVTIFLVRNNIKEVLLLAKREKFSICLLVIVIFSTLWSDLPFITLRRSVSLVGSTLFGLYLTERYTLKEQLHMLGTMLGIVAILSFLFALFLPSYGLSSDHEGAWQGIFDQKNGLGRIMTLSLLVFFLLCIDESEREFRWIKLALLILTLVLLVRSQSVTSMSMALVISCLILLYKSLQCNFYLRGALFCLYTVLAVGTVFWVSENHGLILKVIDRDLTLSGRVELWKSVIPMVEQHLFLGHGYNAFWIKGGPGEYIVYQVGWDTPHSHNGIIDMWLDLGLVGVFVFGLGLLQAFHNSIKYVKQTNISEALWPLGILTYFLISNFLESGILRHNNIYWILYVSITTFFYRSNKNSIA